MAHSFRVHGGCLSGTHDTPRGWAIIIPPPGNDPGHTQNNLPGGDRMAFWASERLRELISMRRDLQSRPGAFSPSPREQLAQKSSKISRRPVGDGDIPTDLIPKGIVSDGRRVERGQSSPQILCGRFQGARKIIQRVILKSCTSGALLRPPEAIRSNAPYDRPHLPHPQLEKSNNLQFAELLAIFLIMRITASVVFG